MAVLPESHRDWGCLLVLPPETSNVSRGCEVPAGLLHQRCSKNAEFLQIAGSQKGLAWKAVAQSHLPMALLAERHRGWGFLIVLPPQTSNVSRGCEVPAGLLHQRCSKNAEFLQIAGSQKGLAWKAVAQPHLPMHCSHRGTVTGHAGLSCHLKDQT